MPPLTQPPDLTLGSSSRTRRGRDRGWDTVLMTDEAREYADFVRQSAAEFIPTAKATKVRRARVMARWIEMHEKRWDSYRDREFSDGDLFVRIQDFLTYAVEASQGLLHKGETLNMAYSTLQMVTFDIFALVKEFSPTLKTNPSMQQVWLKDLHTHAKYLTVLHELPTDKSPKVYIQMMDLIFLITTAITFTRCMDNTLQHIFLWSCMMYIAGRPGSFIATYVYPEWFMKWEDFTLIRTKNLYEFIVQMRVVAWKGGHGFNPWHTCFRLGPTQEEAHMIVDPGLLLIIIALRHGDVFADHSDLASLLAGNDVVIRFHPEVLKQPVFVIATGGGYGIDTETAMPYQAFCAFFRKTYTAKKPTLIRRSAASLHDHILGDTLTCGIMHHKKNTDMLGRHYSSTVAQTDVVSSISSHKKATIMGITELDAPRLFCNQVDSRNNLPLTLEEALVRPPELRLLHQQRDILREYVLSGAEMPDLDSDELRVVQDSLLPAELRCKKLLAHMRDLYRKEQRNRQRAVTVPLTLDDLDRRLAEAHEDREIITLIRALAKADKASNGDKDQDIVQCAAPGNPEDADSMDTLQHEQLKLLHELIEFVDHSKRLPVCPLCQDNNTLPLERRKHVYSNFWHRDRHLQAKQRNTLLSSSFPPRLNSSASRLPLSRVLTYY
ncbi:hypothetical protein OH76DRAFT_1486207 [Lentinus brumalis]|uniref:Uncharacterized protein n=1 Tax=Lentinus brumalis TaxID=2498619 RepID=A0A371CZ32_9APHY|nr:hypothetical protein OH76DRAFT_1486207 [Polyporus brumalis]